MDEALRAGGDWGQCRRSAEGGVGGGVSRFRSGFRSRFRNS